MTETADPRPLLARALGQTAAIVHAVTADDLGKPTPCDDYDVRGVLRHLLGVLDRIAALPRGVDILTLPRDVTDVDDDALGSEFDARAELAGRAWADDAALRRTYRLPWGEHPGFVAVAAYAQELTVHGWDVAIAIGYPEPLDPALGEAVFEIARRAVPAEVRGGPVPFAPVVDTPDEADVYLRLAGWLGRRPVVAA